MTSRIDNTACSYSEFSVFMDARCVRMRVEVVPYSIGQFVIGFLINILIPKHYIRRLTTDPTI